jgi:hypothetical protein
MAESALARELRLQAEIRLGTGEIILASKLHAHALILEASERLNARYALPSERAVSTQPQEPR